MHVLYLHQHFSTPKGAAGIRSYEMARGLLRNNHSVTMVCGKFGPGNTGLETPFVKGRREGLVDGIRVIEFEVAYSNKLSFFQRSMQFMKFASRSLKVALTEDYDLIFASSTPLTAAIPGICARWLRRKPFVFEVRDLWPELPKAMGAISNPLILGAMSVLAWAAYKSAIRIVGLAPGMVDGIEKWGVPRSRIAMVPNGCDNGIFAGASPDAWRPGSVGSGDLLAVYTGTHGAANGLMALVEAATELKRRKRDDIKILLVGDGLEKLALQAKARERGLDNLLFLDPINKSRIAQLLAGADVGIQSLANIPEFYFGTSPNKFFDYIAAGLPVLCNYPGWLAGMIEMHHCGYAVPPDNADALADALEAAAADKAGLRRMGQNGRKLAEGQFDRKLLVDQWLGWVVDGKHP